MKNLKKSPRKQLEKFSTIFTQLGLVIVLFVVYVTLEYQAEQKSVASKPEKDFQYVVLQPEQEIMYQIEKKIVQKTAPIKHQKLILDQEFKKVDDKTDETITVLPKNPEPNSFDINNIVTVDEPIDDEPEMVDYVIIENAPIFKGCEGLSKVENKKCFDKKMNQFVQRNFDSQLATDIGLRSGKYKIYTQFVIDNKGNVVDIQIRTPHPKLTKETQELIEKLPKFTPGKQREKPVKVRYTLPISFQVD
ncbi:energy transducer TonB [Polaribacter sp. BAL334]|uniref:energy transducer TonB n=1 Tax=Polaribacter sp. BAL334 TaxID=1708178 RepID=UPI0018D268DB|nr:energy transducer TonB [Polaribacter sp. BAL334]MBG7612062.1 energy transducer TonB [Polaribacter sp. BAL334]